MTMFISGSSTSSGSLGTLNLGSTSPNIDFFAPANDPASIRFTEGGTSLTELTYDGSHLRLKSNYANRDIFLDTPNGDLMIDSTNGNVGINTSSPSTTRRLHIYNTDDTRGIYIENTSATSYAELHLKANREYRIGTGGASSAADAQNNFYVYDNTATAHRFTINSSGNVGIGLTSPQFKLHISGSTDLLWLQGSGAPQLRMTDNSATSDGDTFALIDFAGMDHAGSSAVFNRISNVIVDNTQGTTDSRLGIHNHVAGTLTEVLSVASGKVGIGTTNPSANLSISGSGDSTKNELSIESDVYPILRFKSYGNNANNREFRFASVYNTYGKFEILSATNNTAAATTTRLSISGVTGDIEFPTANAKLSGSASSTGSFGAGRFSGNVGIFTSGSKGPNTP